MQQMMEKGFKQLLKVNQNTVPTVEKYEVERIDFEFTRYVPDNM